MSVGTLWTYFTLFVIRVIWVASSTAQNIPAPEIIIALPTPINATAHDLIVVEPGKNYTFRLGDRFDLDCYVGKHGRPDLQMSWSKDEALFVNTASAWILGWKGSRYEDYELRISEFTVGDAGTYTCEVGGSKQATVVIQAFPHFIGPQKRRQKAHRGTNTALHCLADGAPKPRVSWWRDDQRLGNETTLPLTNISMADNGTYLCRAESRAGRATSEVSLLVTEELAWTSRSEAEQTVPLGALVPLHCKAKGYPPPYVEWFHTLNDIRRSLKFYAGQSMVNVHITTLNDTGSYTCIAKSFFPCCQKEEAQPSISTTFKLSISESTVKPGYTTCNPGDDSCLSGGRRAITLSVLLFLLTAVYQLFL